MQKMSICFLRETTVTSDLEISFFDWKMETWLLRQEDGDLASSTSENSYLQLEDGGLVFFDWKMEAPQDL